MLSRSSHSVPTSSEVRPSVAPHIVRAIPIVSGLDRTTNPDRSETTTIDAATTLTFAFETIAGEQRALSVAPGSFIGALLYDDSFSRLSMGTDAGCLCGTSFAIDNLAVQAVPEPSTTVLLSTGLAGLLLLRQFRRR